MGINYTSDGTVVSLQFDVIFDEAVLTAGDVVSGVQSPHSVSLNLIAPGQLRLLVFAFPLAVIASASPLATIPFDIAASTSPTTTLLTIQEAVLSDTVPSAVIPRSD